MSDKKFPKETSGKRRDAGNIMRMRDIHCHILPGLDDGADSMEQSLRMIQEAYARGVRAIIATPHLSPLFSRHRPEQIVQLCRKVEEAAWEKLNIRIRIHPGNEIFYTVETLNDLQKGNALTLAQSRYVLLEFSPEVSWREVQRVIREMEMARYWPILAHVERYSCMRTPGRLEEACQLGAYLQMNGNSLAGGFFDQRADWCRKQLLEERIHFIGTDMHNLTTRGGISQKAEAWMKKRLDPEYRKKILWIYPGMVMTGRRIIEN